jgi:hypothetical protein
MSEYQPGDYSKRHLSEVKEICGLRKLMGMPCSYCVYQGQNGCPKIQKKLSSSIVSVNDTNSF